MEDVNTNFKVIGLSRLGIKPESTAPEADALTTRSSEQLYSHDLGLQLCILNKILSIFYESVEQIAD